MEDETAQGVQIEELGRANVDNIRPFSFPLQLQIISSEKPETAKGVRGCCPPPFLMKTFTMVEDPNTNSLISWSSSGTSFIIWDHLQFSAELLPRYFKHSNFSSFIYQLNNYGFRKIGLRQYEYENKWFQAGQEHLLQNIKRRNECNHQERPRQQRSRRRCLNAENYGMKAELENLRNNIDLIKMEIHKLKQEKSDFENHVGDFKQLIKDMETKWDKIVMFLTRAFDSSFVQQITRSIEEEQELESHQTVKKMMLVARECSSKPTDKASTSGQGVNCKNQIVPLEKQAMSCLYDSGSTPIQGQESNNAISEAIAPENCDRIIWKKFLEDDSICENEAEKEQAEQRSKMDMAMDDLMASKIVMEVEDVIAKEPIMDVDDEVTLQLWT